MRILVIGNGGREHALAWKIGQSPLCTDLLIAPGNPGTAELGTNIPIRPTDVDALASFAEREQVDLVVVGPESALAAGLADALARRGIRCFGPTQAAARIESSKAWSKQLMQAAGVPTADFRIFPDPTTARGFLRVAEWQDWRVVKQDGLAAGKGVVVAGSAAELDAALANFGASNGQLLLEEPLAGEELSVLALCDGHTAIPLLTAQDHKRLCDGDAGPNTGGMGAYAPVSHLADDLTVTLQRVVFEPIMAALAAAQTPFVGVLYAGLMLTSDGPKVLEFNARFGDPEAQALLPLFAGDLLAAMIACTEGRLTPEHVRWHPGVALGVVLAAAGYPGQPRTGDPLTLPPAPPDVLIFHAGTALENDRLLTAGGRVLTVVGLAPTLETARDRAYQVAAQVDFAGKQLRYDIGRRALARGQG